MPPGFRPLIFSLPLISLLVVINIVMLSEDNTEVKELPPSAFVQVDVYKRINDEWKAKVAEQDRIEAEGRQNLIYMADIKRELHSMRAQYNIFLKINHKIEADRREASRQERIRIQREKAEERKRLREEKAAERKKHALDTTRKPIQGKRMGKSRPNA